MSINVIVKISILFQIINKSIKYICCIFDGIRQAAIKFFFRKLDIFLLSLIIERWKAQATREKKIQSQRIIFLKIIMMMMMRIFTACMLRMLIADFPWFYYLTLWTIAPCLAYLNLERGVNQVQCFQYGLSSLFP